VKILSLLILLVSVVPAGAGVMTLEPSSVVQGGIVTLRYDGDPPGSAVARFFETPLLLYPAGHGAMRLLGVDLATKPGQYQIPVLVESQSGQHEQFRLTLEVRPRVAEVEKLTLPDAMVSPKSPDILARIDREAAKLKNLFALHSKPKYGNQFRLPVGDSIGSRFGVKRILNGQPRSAHSGVDFRSPRGRQVNSPAPAVVVSCGDYFFTGRTVVLDHGGGLLSLLAHLDTIRVAEGDSVALGQSIGTVGSSGRATGAHLHWSVRLNQARVDPLALFEVFNGEKP